MLFKCSEGLAPSILKQQIETIPSVVFFLAFFTTFLLLSACINLPQSYHNRQKISGLFSVVAFLLTASINSFLLNCLLLLLCSYLYLFCPQCRCRDLQTPVSYWRMSHRQQGCLLSHADLIVVDCTVCTSLREKHPLFRSRLSKTHYSQLQLSTGADWDPCPCCV